MSYRIKQLAINGEGFLFDPTSGESFTTNGTAAFVVRAMQEERSATEIIQMITEEYDVDQEQAERDYAEFTAQLKLNQLI